MYTRLLLCAYLMPSPSVAGFCKILLEYYFLGIYSTFLAVRYVDQQVSMQSYINFNPSIVTFIQEYRTNFLANRLASSYLTHFVGGLAFSSFIVILVGIQTVLLIKWFLLNIHTVHIFFNIMDTCRKPRHYLHVTIL